MDLSLLALLTVHFLGDFPLQGLLPGNVAIRKSHSWPALLLHTSTYSVLFLSWGWKFALVTFVVHTLTDAITSRLTTRWWFIEMTPRLGMDQRHLVFKSGYSYYAKAVDSRKRALFFTTIGFDQLLHAAQLLLTLWWLGR